jgi:glycine dehydrogenase subunit 1
VPGVTLVNDSFFNEFTLRLPREARPVVRTLAERRILAGVSLGRLYTGERAALTASTSTVPSSLAGTGFTV